MHKDPLDKIIPVLVTRNCSVSALEIIHGDRHTVNEWHAGTVRTSFADPFEIPAQEFITANLEALLDDFGGELVHAVLSSIAQNMFYGTATVGWCAMLADMLDAPIAKLAMSDDVDVVKHLIQTRTLWHWLSQCPMKFSGNTCFVFFKAILEDILHHQTSSLT